MPISLHSEDTLFTPAEAETITGVGVAMQRDWRRRGIIAKASEGWARFGREALAEMMIIKLLADAGIPPLVSKDWADWAAWRLADHALDYPGAEEVQGRDLLEQFEARTGVKPRLPGRFQHSDGSKTDQRFLAVKSGFAPTLTSDLNSLFVLDPQVHREVAAYVVLDLVAAGLAMAERAGRPLHVVIVSDSEDE